MLSGGDQLLQLNLGSGRGNSVLEAFGRACGHAIPDMITQWRSGDAAITVVDNSEAQQQLGWQTKRNLDDMFQTAGGGSRPIRTDTPPLKPLDSPC